MRNQKLLCVCTVSLTMRKAPLLCLCPFTVWLTASDVPYWAMPHPAQPPPPPYSGYCIRSECLIFTFRGSFNLLLFFLPLLLTPVMFTPASSLPAVSVSIAYLMHPYKTYFGGLLLERNLPQNCFIILMQKPISSLCSVLKTLVTGWVAGVLLLLPCRCTFPHRFSVILLPYHWLSVGIFSYLRL